MTLSMKIEHSFHLWVYLYHSHFKRIYWQETWIFFSFYETQDLDQYISS